jgi:hypothetical protein
MAQPERPPERRAQPTRQPAGLTDRGAQIGGEVRGILDPA